MNDDNAVQLCDIKTAAKALSVSVHTLYKLAERGTIPHHRIGKRVLFDVKELIIWSKAQKEENNENTKAAK